MLLTFLKIFNYIAPASFFDTFTGFGGVVQSGGVAEHCFNLVPGGANTAAQGINGIMQAYNNAVQSVRLSGPTIFSQVLQTAIGISQSGMNGSQYFTLLIITDGVITDMENTKNAIVAACDYPLSILIVGVGPADFSRMEEKQVEISYNL